MKKIALRIFLIIMIAVALVAAIVSAYSLLTKDFTYINSLLPFTGTSQEELWEEEWQKEKEAYSSVNFGHWTYDINRGFIKNFLLKEMVWKKGDAITKQEFHIFLTYENGEVVLADVPKGTVREYILFIYGQALDLFRQGKIPPIAYRETDVKTIILKESLWAKLNLDAMTIINIALGIGFLLFLLWFARWLRSRGRVKLPSPYRTSIVFADVEAPPQAAGIAEDIIKTVKYPFVYLLNDGKLPHGFLFEGPPGTGKTVTAAALANVLSANGVLCYKISCNALLEDTFGDPGAAAGRISYFFKQARNKKEPCLLIFDEAHILFEKEDFSIAVSQFLNELSGLEEYDAKAYKENRLVKSVAVLAITNKKEVIADAFMRSGRISETVEFPMPDAEKRKAILAIHAKGKNIPAEKREEWFERIAKGTDGFTGADLEAVLQKASNFCTKRAIAELEKQGINVLKMQLEDTKQLKELLAVYPIEFAEIQKAYEEVSAQKQKAVS